MVRAQHPFVFSSPALGFHSVLSRLDLFVSVMFRNAIPAAPSSRPLAPGSHHWRAVALAAPPFPRGPLIFTESLAFLSTYMLFTEQNVSSVI